MSRFRFETFEIWREACRLGDQLDRVASELDVARKYRYAEQLRGAALSVSNNIAEGSGSDSNKDFAHFLNMARRSVYENANMILFFVRNGLIAEPEADQLLEDHRLLAAKIAAFRKSLE